MWTLVLVLMGVLPLGVLGAMGADAVALETQNCSLACVQQGGDGCDYCQITKADVEKTLGFQSLAAFGVHALYVPGHVKGSETAGTTFQFKLTHPNSCVPGPCSELVGAEACQHYVHAPTDVEVELLPDNSPDSDSVVVSWKPSHYGIAFLRGFQVSLQALGRGHTACQLFLFRRNFSLPASHAQVVYTSETFPRLPLGAQYAVTVMALPVPEQWDRFYRSTIYSTRTCAEKNGINGCRKDWYPEQIVLKQQGAQVTVTFNLAPPTLSISKYFSKCYGPTGSTYMGITPDFSKNKTHCSFLLKDLQKGTNYTCEIAADEVDAVRASFGVHVEQEKQDLADRTSTSPMALILPVALSLVLLAGILLLAFCRRPRLMKEKLDLKPDLIIEPCQDKTRQEQLTLLPKEGGPTPRLLICYCGKDGPAHVRAVMQLGAFVQQHMATKVSLDLWDLLSLSEEGTIGWLCRQLQESDFVLVLCSRGLRQRAPAPKTPGPVNEVNVNEEEEEEAGLSSVAAVALIGEEVGRARARGKDLSKYMAAIFPHSEEADIPMELGLVTRYRLPGDLQLLFSHLHGVALHSPGRYLEVEHLSGQGLGQAPAGAALLRAIAEAGMAEGVEEEEEEVQQQQKERRGNGHCVALEL